MIQVKDLKKEFGQRVLMEEVNFHLNPRERIGLVGRNGSGKSTLFKMILGEMSPDGGEISLPKSYKIGSLSQHLTFSYPSILEECASALPEDQKFDDYRAEKILFGLGFQATDMQRPPSAFSGGYQIRLNLAKALLGDPNLLLLDEPTNYLDIVSMRWLRDFLVQFSGEVILITHDRDFMDSVSTHTMGISRQRLKKFKGPSRVFYEQVKLEEEIYEQTRVNQDKKRKEMEEFVERFRAKANKAAQAQSRVKMLDKMETMDKLSIERQLSFQFHHKACPGKVILHAKDLSFGFQPDDLLFSDLTIQMGRNEKIGIIGKNGKGKSTLLNVLAGIYQPLKGEVTYHPSTELGHFGQTNVERLSPQMTVSQEMSSANGELSITEARSICGCMMFEGEQADKKISVLSGGEKSRVLLGKMLAKKTNLLFLDEPTNHLDMESVDSLIEALENYEGAVLMVTHSEEMLKRLATKLIIFHQGRAEFFDGTYPEFLEKIGWEEDQGSGSKKPLKKLDEKEYNKLRQEIVNQRSKTCQPLKDKREKCEELIVKFEGLLEKKNQELISAGDDPQKVAELSRGYGEIQKQIELLFEELEKLEDELNHQEKAFEDSLEDLKKRL